MKRVAKLFLALAVVASPMLFTSCDDYDDNGYYYYNDLVSSAVRNYRYDYPNGSDYYTAYNWFYVHYPEAYTNEFYAFMDAVMLIGTAIITAIITGITITITSTIPPIIN